VRRLCKHYTSFAAPLKIAEFGGSPDELRLGRQERRLIQHVTHRSGSETTVDIDRNGFL
jgi:hypothetical protein